MKAAQPDSALVILGHGSTKNAQSSVSTRRHAAVIRDRGVFGEVWAAFWKEEPALTGILDRVESNVVYLMPHFISEGYFTQRVVPEALGLEGPTTEIDGKTVHYCRPLGTHPDMTRLLLGGIERIVPGGELKGADLLIVGHGTDRDARSGDAVAEQVGKLAQRLPETHVTGIFLDQEPRLRDWRELSHAPVLVVAPFFATEGLHTLEDIPRLLGLSGNEPDNVFGGPFSMENRRIFYCPSVGTDPAVPDLMLELVADFEKRYARTES